MVKETVYRPPSKEEINKMQDAWYENTTSAGSWEKNPLWQRINPFTPSGPTRFVPSESGKKILNEFKNRYGKAIHVVPNKPNVLGNLFGGQEPATDSEIINKLKETYGTLPFQVPAIV